MPENKEQGIESHLGKVVRVGDFQVRRGTIIKVETGGGIFFTDYQVNSTSSKGNLPEGTLVGHTVLTDQNGAMIGRRLKKTNVSPNQKVTPLMVGVYSMMEATVPFIRETRQEEPKTPEEIPFGFDRSRTTLSKLK